MGRLLDSILARDGEVIEIREVGREHTDEMLALQERSINPATFCAITREEIEESLSIDVVTAAFASGKIVALNIVVKNRESSRSLAPDIGESYSRVATFDGVIVAPEYRGLGLQRRFLEIAANLARSWGANRLAATVAPTNLPSRANFGKAGFAELGEFPKYGSTRIVVVKEL